VSEGAPTTQISGAFRVSRAVDNGADEGEEGHPVEWVDCVGSGREGRGGFSDFTSSRSIAAHYLTYLFLLLIYNMSGGLMPRDLRTVQR